MNSIKVLVCMLGVSLGLMAQPVKSIVGARGIGATETGWKNPYITDGLVAMWDGEWNAGPGVHDASAKSWVDLSGNRLSLTVNSGGEFGDNYYFNNGTQAVSATSDIVGLNVYTAEIVVTPIGVPYYMFVAGGMAHNIKWVGIRANQTINFWNGGVCLQGTMNETCHYGCTDDNGNFGLYRNGLPAEALGSGLSGLGTPTNFQVSVFSSKQFRIYTMRFYNRALTAEEIAHNYAIDKARFNLP